jgi:hypothetical protein
MRSSLFMVRSDMADGTPPLTTDAEADAANCGGEAPARPLVARQLAQLGEMVDIGLKIMRAIERQVDAAEGEPQPVAELNAAAMAYARVARAVRQTVMLQDKLAEAQTAGDQAAAAVRRRQDGVRARVAGVVRRVAEAEHDDAEQVERLCAEAAERLEQERFGDEQARPVVELVADICRDLGLHPEWQGLIDEMSAIEALAGGDAAADASPPAPQTIELFWLDAEGRPTPARRRPDSS